MTGGIGSGKSLFCTFLKNLGYVVFSCDEIYGQILCDDTYLASLRERFSDCFPKGNFDKNRLAERVFSNQEDKKTLEALAHPIIMQRLLSRMNEERIAFAEVPLLFEGGFENLFDCVIALVRDKWERIQAVKSRNGLSEAEIVSRMENQFDPALLSDKKCIIVENNGSIEDLKRKAYEISEKLLRESVWTGNNCLN